jgi:hypothetical protein
MNKRYFAPLGIALAIIIALLMLNPIAATASAEPGATVRNAFGPDVGLGANQCRGACGGGCPSSCTIEVSYECAGEIQLRRVEAISCGTHEGCREHDDCLDNCLINNPGSQDCQPQCDAAAMQTYGFEKASPWLLGKGPYDGQITFEYTRHAPAELEPAYRCPPGAIRQCGKDAPCANPRDGSPVDAIFDSYPAANASAMHISGFRAGPLCDAQDRVCEQSLDIRVAGEDTCNSGRCTRFGMEFDYRNADPGAPLECKTSTRGGDGDFIGDLLKLGGDAIAERDAASGGPAKDDGMGQLLGMFGKIIASADSPEDLQVSMTTLDEHGNPDESKRVGSSTGTTPAPIPSSVDLPAQNGRLIVPMYQLAASAKPGTVKERRVTCTHKGEPVLETVFVLQH